MLLRFRTCLDCNVRELDAVRRQTEVWILAGQQDKYYETERFYEGIAYNNIRVYFVLGVTNDVLISDWSPYGIDRFHLN